ncbi:hypothetical protein F2Q70_00010490 [Brassica cretica]|uniref:Large ribosomal subunit protein uL4c n=1 Tax=Brassica cretica TaxID=69181 RepID=A0A8S9MGS5_BRACR|nr:hypothetical protein F2Q70_00010490 [Brassica cretica]
MGLDPKEKTIFLMVDVEENMAKSSRNIGILRKLTQRSLNLFDVLNSNKLVLTLAAVEFLNARYGVEALVTWDEDENVRKLQPNVGGDSGKNVMLEENMAKSSRNIGILRKLTQRSLNLFDVLNSNKLVLTLAAVEFLNARYGVEALVTWDEDENVRKLQPNVGGDSGKNVMLEV